MIITINGTSYEGLWGSNTLTLETDMPLSELEAAFVPGENAEITVADGEHDIAHYYNKGLESMTVNNTIPRQVIVVFDVSKISEDVETEIRNALEDSDGAIVELAEIVSELSEYDITDIKSYINNLRGENGIIANLEARIAALENKNPEEGV